MKKGKKTPEEFKVAAKSLLADEEKFNKVFEFLLFVWKLLVKVLPNIFEFTFWTNYCRF